MVRFSSHCLSNPTGRRSHTFPKPNGSPLTLSIGLVPRSLSLGSPSPRQKSYPDLESGRKWKEGDTLTPEKQMPFLKRPMNRFCRAISKKFQAPKMPVTEVASFDSSQHFIRETKIEIFNLSDIEEAQVSALQLLPETESNHELHHIRNGSSQKDIIINSSTEEENIDTRSSHGLPTVSESYSCMDVDQRTNDRKKVKDRIQVIMKWFLLVGTFSFEVLTAIFDQLTSPHRSLFALFATVTSFFVIGLCLIEIFCKCGQGKYAWKMKGKLYWLYNARDGKPFGTFMDIFGLVCGTIQFILTAVSYGFYYSQHVNSPIKLPVCSMVFAFCLLVSKLLDEMQKR